MKEAGFDHTEFSEDMIDIFFSTFGLKKEPRLVGTGLGFEFTGAGITFVTLYNPLTGLRSGNDKPTKNKGFTGYIGLYGEEDIVDEAVKFIKENSDHGEYSEQRDFI